MGLTGRGLGGANMVGPEWGLGGARPFGKGAHLVWRWSDLVARV